MIKILTIYLFLFVIIPFLDGFCGKDIKRFISFLYRTIIPLRLRFEIDFYISKIILKKTDNLFSYPLLASLTFKKEKYWEKFKKEKSMQKIIELEAKKMSSSLIRKMGRNPSREVIDRAYRISELKENTREVYELYGEKI